MAISRFINFLVALLIAAGLFLAACSSPKTSDLDIPEGFATQTLKQFAKQAGVEIIFDSQSVYGVKTNPVQGKHDPRSALKIMLKGTPLSVDFDEETGAYAVIRIDLSSTIFSRNVPLAVLDCSN
ncbi:MAG: STN domain-containing protein [Verrucomicrobiae bacterium]|nr:STN domain-containing protein [Verrucomicrobiae bacterium]